MTFTRLAEWGGDDAPARVLLFPGDFPLLDQPLPRFLDDAAAAKLLRAARADAGPARPPDRRAAGPHRDRAVSSST